MIMANIPRTNHTINIQSKYYIFFKFLYSLYKFLHFQEKDWILPFISIEILMIILDIMYQNIKLVIHIKSMYLFFKYVNFNLFFIKFSARNLISFAISYAE